MWYSRLRSWHCHSYGAGYKCGAGLIPGLRTSTCNRGGHKKNKQKQTKKLPQAVNDIVKVWDKERLLKL